MQDVLFEIGYEFLFLDPHWDPDFKSTFLVQLVTPMNEVLDSKEYSLTGSQFFYMPEGGTFHALPMSFTIPSEKMDKLNEGERALLYLRESLTDGSPEDWSFSPEVVVMADRDGKITASTNKLAHMYLAVKEKPDLPAEDIEELVELQPEAEPPLGAPIISPARKSMDLVLVFMLVILAVFAMVIRFTLNLSHKKTR